MKSTGWILVRPASAVAVATALYSIPMASSLLVGVGSALDRATLRVLGRAFNTRGGRRDIPVRDPVVLLEHGRAFYERPETRARYYAAPPIPRVRETARERLLAGAVVD